MIRLPTLIIATSLLSALSSVTASAGSDPQPDIVFVLVDDLRYDALSFLGHPYIETPHLDRLREQGAWMENAFVTTSICCPSRATYLTGTYSSRHGVIDNETSEYVPEITPPLTKYLQEAGYHVAMIGKWHMGYSGKPRPFFDTWLSFDGQGVYFDPELIHTDGSREVFEGYTTDILSDEAIKFIERHPDDQPFFLKLSHKAVHEPFQPAPRHKNAYGYNTRDPEPASFSDTFEGKPKWQRRQRVRDVRWDWRTREIEEEVIPESIELEPWRSSKKYVDQLRCLASVDEGIGRIVETLRKRGALNNTLIVFASDNGYFHMEHRRWDKRLAYEEGLRIPMIMVYPGKIEPGSTISEMVLNVDFAPTVLSYAGIEVPEQMQGYSVRPLFEGVSTEWRDAFFYEYYTDLVHEIPTMKALRGERFKLIHYPEIDDIDELYDLENDPNEMRNLAKNPEYAAVHREMTERLAKESQRLGWDADIFPHNLERVRGPVGTLLDLKPAGGGVVDAADPERKLHAQNIKFSDDQLVFNGSSSQIRIPFDPEMDPSIWPYRVSVDVNVESDGVIATQSSPGYGFKLFVQDGRPGISVICKTWVANRTTIDGPESILDTWTKLEAEIDYNRLRFWVDGELIDVMTLPLPFKAKTNAPLIIGAGGKHRVNDKVPHNPFKGVLRSFRIERHPPE